MRVYLIRHAIAFERDRRRWPDDRRRPLTPEGTSKFRKAAAGLGRLVGQVDRVLASPLTRARQTAEILTAVAGWPQALEAPELAPGRAVEQALALIGDRAAADSKLESLALVGHEPSLGELLSLSVAGSRTGVQCKIRKGGAVCLFFPGARSGEARPERAARARLEWLITPKALRALARR